MMTLSYNFLAKPTIRVRHAHSHYTTKHTTEKNYESSRPNHTGSRSCVSSAKA